MENSKYSCHSTRLNLCLLPRIIKLFLQYRYFDEIRLNIHDARIKKKEKRKEKIVRKSVVRVLHPAALFHDAVASRDKINRLLTTRHFITPSHLSFLV